MSLFYVTGVPGTGKSAVQKELTQQGYEAFDIDGSRFGGPVNKATGKSTTVPPIEQRSADWFDQHEWRVSRPAIEELKESSAGKNVYLCGTATTENLVWDLFDKILYLNIDENTLKTRIANREDNDFGKTDDELQLILERYRTAQENLGNLAVTIIDATSPIEDVIRAVIKES